MTNLLDTFLVGGVIGAFIAGIYLLDRIPDKISRVIGISLAVFLLGGLLYKAQAQATFEDAFGRAPYSTQERAEFVSGEFVGFVLARDYNADYDLIIKITKTPQFARLIEELSAGLVVFGNNLKAVDATRTQAVFKNIPYIEDTVVAAINKHLIK